jgi:hypothetical protein
MKPSQVSRAIEERVRNQIRKSLPVHQSLPELSDLIDQFLQDGKDGAPLVKDPYLEAVPIYDPGATLRQLVEEGVILQKTAKIFACYFLGHGDAEPGQVTLHQHQAEAIRQVCRDGKNLIVCSGTGSGKTESFLIPLIDSLMRECSEEGGLSDGVRAMILYPMNALVNDQIRRLRKVLIWAPEIKFGKFTGETEEEEQIDGDDLEGLETELENLEPNLHSDYARLDFDDEKALKNEVNSRQKWRNNPGHILVTNYSMLERLLLQPKDSKLFRSTWRFIVLDEAHCYSGALGTEIAWLIRRVKRRVEGKTASEVSLRFLATSATLISDETLNDEQRGERIRNNFASRLFPAPPDSFAVQFGKPEETPTIQDGGQHTDPARYITLVSASFENSTLLEVSEGYLGRVTWRNRVMEQVNFLLQNQDRDAALGDLLSVTSLSRAAAVCSSMDSEEWNSLMKPTANVTGLLDQASQLNVAAMLQLAKKAIGPMDDPDKWRSLLHDHSDPSPSSYPKDTYQRNEQVYPKSMGNRLHLLAEWQKDVNFWSWEALDWLLGIVSGLAASTDTETEPGALKVRMSATCVDLLTRLCDRMENESKQDLQLASSLDLKWADLLGNQPSGNFQQTLAEALREDAALALLRSELKQANTDAQAHRATSASLAARLFVNDTRSVEALDALVALATLAKEKGKRTPLLDIRYHQMIRGIEAPGLQLQSDALGENVTPTLVAEGSGEGLTLGLCRDCGQPFALGYAETPNLDAYQIHSLSAERGARRRFLHAFIWQRGLLPEDMENPEVADQNDLWLNTRESLFRHGAPGQNEDNEWVPVLCHAQPHVTEYPEFIKMCPTCGVEQQPRSGSRYGIITPFEAAGDSVRVVAMEELAKQAGASGDPVARTLPGEGRKLLAFSDSRSGSASLALTFQDYHAETILEPLLILAAKKAEEAFNPTNEEVLRANGVVPADWQMYFDAPKIMNNQRGIWLNNHPQIPTYSRVSGELEILLRQQNLGGLLSVAAVRKDENSRDERPIGELTLPEAAQWRLLQALARKGRHSVRRRGLLRISNSKLANPPSEVLEALGLDSQTGPETYNRVVEALLARCIDTVEIKIPDPFPREGLQRHAKIVTRDGVNKTLSWAGTKAKVFLRSVIAENTSFWRSDLIKTLRDTKKLQTAPAKQLVERLDLAETFNECIKAICSAKNNPAAAVTIPNKIAKKTSPTCREDFVTGIRTFFNNQAATWLNTLWVQFTGAEVLIAITDNGDYRLNPEALLIHSVTDALADAPELIPLRIEEHTAQLAKSRGSNYQRAFAEGNINILSCSTTFEMGVDLGDLSCVFLNGMPPSVANYRQRAGRAGRRPGSPSYVLTFLGRRDHDRYFWEHPEKLLFARLEEPKIYLENRIFRARHLRAEALHDFLAWQNVGTRKIDANASKHSWNNGIRQDQPGEHKHRRWDLVGDLLVGVTAGSKHDGGQYPVTWRFSPLVEEMPNWQKERETALQAYLESMDGIDQNGIGYQVAADLIWQIKQQALDGQAITPYALVDANHESDYRLLGGPNWPAVDANGLVPAHNDARNRTDLRRCSVETQVRYYFTCNPDRMTGFQKHLLREQTITWLSRCRVLPKYGFPVDVINLLPHKDDSYGRNVKLERDLKIGLYEYAPQQVIVADKRRYRSAKVVVWDNGQFTDASNNLDQRWICQGCHEPDWDTDPNAQNAPHSCRFCGDDLKPVKLCFPDAFQADISTPSYQVRGERGTPIHVHTRAFRARGALVPKTGLITKESESGSITYINQGPGYREYSQGGSKFSLCHEIRTDIAGWMFTPTLLGPGTLLHAWANENFNGRRRRDAALRSALQAILRAAARVKDIEERDIQGLVLPGDGANGEIGIVLFDDSSGGGGAVLDLILTGHVRNAESDGKNAARIREILETAKNLCEICKCGNGHDTNHMPVTREELLDANVSAHNFRLATSCYDCLRSHRNQREHGLLDRHDAARLLDTILQSQDLPQGTFDRNTLDAVIMNDFCFRLDDGTTMNVSKLAATPNANQWVLLRAPSGSWAYGEWFLTERTQTAGAPVKRLRLLNGVGLSEGMMITEDQLRQLDIWKQTF